MIEIFADRNDIPLNNYSSKQDFIHPTTIETLPFDVWSFSRNWTLVVHFGKMEQI